MDSHRIYGDQVSISVQSVKDFYNKQAERASDPLGAVLLGHQDETILAEKNSYTQKHIVPKLKVNAGTRVLDLGCGIGRMAEFLLPHCAFYCGVDFSEKMVEKANIFCESLASPEKFHIYCMPITQAVISGTEFGGATFELIILSGILMYLNDNEIKQIVRALPNLLSQHCVIYLGNPVGLGRRLTLKNFHSESLQTEYNAIYRTADEYVTLLQPLLQSGFSIKEQKYFPKFGDTYTDTSRFYMLLER